MFRVYRHEKGSHFDREGARVLTLRAGLLYKDGALGIFAPFLKLSQARELLKVKLHQVARNVSKLRFLIIAAPNPQP